MNTISVIGCIVGVVTCLVGVSSFISAMLTKSRQDGIMVAKIDQCVQGISEIKKDIKDKNQQLDQILDQHSKDISSMKAEIKTLFAYIKEIREDEHNGRRREVRIDQ